MAGSLGALLGDSRWGEGRPKPVAQCGAQRPSARQQAEMDQLWYGKVVSELAPPPHTAKSLFWSSIGSVRYPLPEFAHIRPLVHHQRKKKSSLCSHPSGGCARNKIHGSEAGKRLVVDPTGWGPLWHQRHPVGYHPPPPPPPSEGGGGRTLRFSSACSPGQTRDLHGIIVCLRGGS